MAQPIIKVILVGCSVLALQAVAFCQSEIYLNRVSGAAHPLNQHQTQDDSSILSKMPHSESGQPAVWTTRSFLFKWPGQNAQNLKLNLCEPLVTDRPDFTEASSTVGRGVSQWELGYTYSTDKSNGSRTDQHSYPELLLRQGLCRDWFELRIAYNAGTFQDSTFSNSGSDDLYIGAKIGLTPQDGILPEMALIPQATLATGSADFTNDAALFGTNWVYSWQLTDDLSLAGSTQFNHSLDGVTGKQYTQWAQSIAIGKSLTDRFGAYGEWYAFFPDDADTDGVEQYLNGGFSLLLSDNVQWDIRAGMGLNQTSQDFFTGTGLSIRFR